MPLLVALFLLYGITAKKARAKNSEEIYDITSEAELAIKYDRCIDAVNILVEKEREDSLSSYQYSLLAKAFSCLESYQAAIDVYTSLLKKEPDNISYTYNRAINYAANQRTGKAFKNCQKLQLLAPKDTFYCTNCSEYAYNTKHYKEAQIWIERHISQNPEDSEAQLLLAKVLLQQKDFNQALLLINSYIAGNPINADGYLVRAQLYEQTQMQRFASADYKTYLQINTNDHKIWIAYGNLLIKMNHTAEACSAFDAAKQHGSLNAGKSLYKYCGKK